MKGGSNLKKICILLCVCIIFTLCSCRKLNQTDNTDFTSNNSSLTTSSDYSSEVSQLTLPERAEPNTSSSSSVVSDSSQQDIVTNYDEGYTSSQETVNVDNLNIETDKPDYSTFAESISFTLFSDTKEGFFYYTDFFLQKYENGKWIYVATKNGSIDYKFNTATASNYVESLYINVSELYETPLTTGRYRIVQESDDGSIISNEFGIVEEMPENQDEPV